LKAYFETALNPAEPAIWVGDLNVAPEPIDVYHPEKRVNDVDFHIDARTAYKEAVSWGFVDVFRRLHPNVVQYTYWDYFRNALERNFGWRIDHILATATLAEKCHRAEVDMAPRKIKGASSLLSRNTGSYVEVRSRTMLFPQRLQIRPVSDLGRPDSTTCQNLPTSIVISTLNIKVELARSEVCPKQMFLPNWKA
jgi:hypothetical protein